MIKQLLCLKRGSWINTEEFKQKFNGNKKRLYKYAVENAVRAKLDNRHNKAAVWFELAVWCRKA